MIHNTHLRSIDMNQYAFVDAALYAIFGSGIQFLKLGEEANMDAPSDLSTHSPCYYTGSRIDGMYIPYSKNQFRYPHPETPLESFLYQPEQT
jgi:hypothetical protein